MLAMADQNGYVGASVPGLASRARVSLEACLAALDAFQKPDEWSRTKEFEGRRIAEADGGWILLNHAKYRAAREADERRDYMKNYMRDKRAAEALTPVSNVSPSKPGLAQAEAEAKADTKAKQKKEPVRGSRLPQGWKPDAELALWASSERPDLDHARELASFRDYWQAVAGAKGVKLDWPATYRNWIRRANGGIQRAAANSAPSKARQKINNLQEFRNGLAKGRNSDGVPAADMPLLGSPTDRRPD